MDKYDVIDPVTDLAKLEDDYFNWNTLPFNRRMRANDNCISMHGCTVPEYYDKLRDAIVRSDSNTTPDNIESVSEEVYLTPESMEKDMELFVQIQELKKNPYIVLITPDINTIESLTAEYNRFLDLTPKNKRISNEYSYQFFGLNVYNMYSKILGQISNDDETIDSSNAETLDESTNIIYCKKSEEALYERALFKGDKLSAEIIKRSDHSLLESSSYISPEPKYNNISDLNTDILVGTSLPFFTRNELDKFDSSFVTGGRVYTTKGYYEKLRDYTKLYNNDKSYADKLIELGWNPEVPYNKFMGLAKQRWVDYLNENAPECIDITKFMNAPTDYSTPDIEDRTGTSPVYIILGFDKDSIEYTFNPYKYDKLAICFNILDIIKYGVYVMNGNFRENFNGFTFEKKLTDCKFIYIIALYLDHDTLVTLLNNINNMKNPIDIVKEYIGGSIFNLVSRTTNEYSPDNAKIFYAHLCDFIYRLVAVDIHTGDIDDSYRLNFNTPNIFKVYGGKLEDFNELEAQRIVNINTLITGKESREIFVRDLMGKYNISDTVSNVEGLEKTITPSNIITKRDK